MTNVQRTDGRLQQFESAVPIEGRKEPAYHATLRMPPLLADDLRGVVGFPPWRGPDAAHGLVRAKFVLARFVEFTIAGNATDEWDLDRAFVTSKLDRDESRAVHGGYFKLAGLHLAHLDAYGGFVDLRPFLQEAPQGYPEAFDSLHHYVRFQASLLVDKVLLAACEVHGLTPCDLDQSPSRANQLCEILFERVRTAQATTRLLAALRRPGFMQPLVRTVGPYHGVVRRLELELIEARRRWGDGSTWPDPGHVRITAGAPPNCTVTTRKLLEASRSEREPTEMQRVRRAATLRALPSSDMLALDGNSVLLAKLREQQAELRGSERIAVRFGYDSLRRDLEVLREKQLVHPRRLQRMPGIEAEALG